MTTTDRRAGLEQEFFLVEPGGESSDRADDVIRACHQLATDAKVDAARFTGEWVKNILELNCRPATDPHQLAREYLTLLRVVLDAAAECGIRVYPLSAYPLHLVPKIRDTAANHAQVRTVGFDRFLNAGRCTGTHLHIEAPPGTIDPRVAVSYSSTPQARHELLDAYNLATALDPVLIALGRSCPFYEGDCSGLAYHTTRYRGSAEFGWEGVYTHLPAVGGLRPYADSVERLVELQFERHAAWLSAMDRAGVDRTPYAGPGGLLRSSWNPVRLNAHGTVEMRDIDSNLPAVVLGIVTLVQSLFARVRAERLRVTPAEGATAMRVEAGRLVVPDFEHLNSRLLFGAVTQGIGDPTVRDYVASVFQLCGPGRHEPWLGKLIPRLERFSTTEERLLSAYRLSGEQLPRSQGLELVRRTCDEFESQTAELCDAAGV